MIPDHLDDKPDTVTTQSSYEFQEINKRHLAGEFLIDAMKRGRTPAEYILSLRWPKPRPPQQQALLPEDRP